MLLYRASLPLSRQTLAYATGAVRRHRRAIGSKGRCLPPGMQALMTLVYLRKGETYAELGAGFAVSTTTAWRHVNETVDLPAARAPKLGPALARAVKNGLPYLVLDGTLIPIDRVAADRPYSSGKHRRTGRCPAVGVGTAARLGPRPGGGPDLGRHPGAGCRWAARAGRQGLPGRRPAHPHPQQGTRQARTAKGRQPRTRQVPRTRRTRERPAQVMENPAEAALLSPPRRPHRQSHPRPATPRDRSTLKKAHSCGCRPTFYASVCAVLDNPYDVAYLLRGSRASAVQGRPRRRRRSRVERVPGRVHLRGGYVNLFHDGRREEGSGIGIGRGAAKEAEECRWLLGAPSGTGSTHRHPGHEPQRTLRVGKGERRPRGARGRVRHARSCLRDAGSLGHGPGLLRRRKSDIEPARESLT
ncbi:Helix-turn-helix of DDE superfamily endonuclease [Actinomadura glauciflava]|nr:Helix-turn-helix of DDE superfamily endonuclease [Actinomadura glauciflava]